MAARRGACLTKIHLLLLAALALPCAALALPGAALPASSAAPAPVGARLPSAERAPIALLADLTAGQVLFARQADITFLPASMTKAMTALVAFDLIDAGKLDENTIVTISPDLAKRWSGRGTTLNLQAGERVSVHDLLMGAAVVSGNDAAAALGEAALGSEAAWLAAMNARAAQLGMTASHFATANGFPDQGRTYVTAADMVRLAAALIEQHPALYRRYFGQNTMVWRGTELQSHNPIIGVVPGADGIKTGHTFEAGYNFLGAVERGGRRLVLVTGRSWTAPDRAAAAAALAEWGYAAWDSRSFLAAGTVVGQANVQNRDARTVALAVPRAYTLAVVRGSDPAVRGRISYKGPLCAPIAAGQQIAQLELQVPGQPPHTIPLVTQRSVAVAGPIDRIVNGLLGLAT